MLTKKYLFLFLTLSVFPSPVLARPDIVPQGGQQNVAASETQLIARITDKPEPVYTKEARKHQVEGTVILRCVFRSSGKVTDIKVIQGLPNGLTERAIKAAKKIRFTPAMKDGHPVSMWMQLEYTFNLY